MRKLTASMAFATQTRLHSGIKPRSTAAKSPLLAVWWLAPIEAPIEELPACRLRERRCANHFNSQHTNDKLFELSANTCENVSLIPYCLCRA